MSTRTCKVGIHGRNDHAFQEEDFQVIREAKFETVKMMSHTHVDVFRRLKQENPDLQIITRLFHGGGYIESQQFIKDMVPVIGQLQPYCTLFQIGNEPNHLHRIEGWGKEDADAENFNGWFLEVYDALKRAHPWASLGFPGLAVPDPAHRDKAWLRICRDAINKADWLGCHCYWQTPPNGGSVMMADGNGLCFKYYHEMYPDKVIHILECGNSNGQNPAFPVDENLYANEYVQWLTEVFKYPYIGSASFFILSSPDDAWHSFAWRRNGHKTRMVSAVADMARPQLVPVQVKGPTKPTPPTDLPMAPIPLIFTNQHLINACFFTAGELGIKGDDLMAKAGLDVHQLAANEQVRQTSYTGLAIEQLPNLSDHERTRIRQRLVDELRNIRRWRGLTNAEIGLNLRDRPGADSQILTTLPYQTAIDVLHEQEKWLFVATDTAAETHAVGFAHGDYVQNVDVPTKPEPVLPTGTLPGFFCSDPTLITVPLAAASVDKLALGTGAGEGSKRLVDIWNRYGGLLSVLAEKLSIDPAVAVAVLAVESGGTAFVDGRMIIRFENHLFYREWGQQHAERFFQHYTFSHEKSWEGHTFRLDSNQPFQEFHGSQQGEWSVLDFSVKLDDTAAKRSISMGTPQILGSNHATIGYKSVQDMFNAFWADERNHILGLFDFIRARPDLVSALQSGDYTTFASGYNGSGQAEFYSGLIQKSVTAFRQLRANQSGDAFGVEDRDAPVLARGVEPAISHLPMPVLPDVFVNVGQPSVATEPSAEEAMEKTQPTVLSSDPKMRELWLEHVENGLANNNTMFKRILGAFMIPYYMTIAMYCVLFIVGIGLFVIAARLSVTEGSQIAGVIFGGLGVATFIGYFLSRPLQALEENLQLITWLGMTYNTYWTRLLYAQDQETIHDDIKDATADAIAELEQLIDKSKELASQRPNVLSGGRMQGEKSENSE